MFVILLASIVLFFLSIFSHPVRNFFHSAYFFILLAYTWYITILLFWGEHKQETFPQYEGEKIAVLIPYFNEDPRLLLDSIRSVHEARGNKEIFIVDDGSTSGIDSDHIKKVCEAIGAEIHFFEANQGKRHALHHAVKNMIKDHKFVVTIDSDTILDRDALIRVVEPLKAQSVGASTGDVRLLNENENFLTRMVGAYYWVGLQIFKKAQSNLGIVVCCSGCLAAYRSDILLKIIDEFVQQRFLGEACTHSEDRHLTNLVLRDGYQVKYTDAAISYTRTPSRLSSFLKQQQRWKRGFIRESTYTLAYAWRVKPVLFFQIILCELTIPFFAFGLMIALIVSLIVYPELFIHSVLPSWIVFMFVRYIHVFFYGRKKIPGLLLYMFFYEILLYWQFIYALFTVRNKSWITR